MTGNSTLINEVAFDVASFFGGIVCALGLMFTLVFIVKFYSARTAKETALAEQPNRIYGTNFLVEIFSVENLLSKFLPSKKLNQKIGVEFMMRIRNFCTQMIRSVCRRLPDDELCSKWHALHLLLTLLNPLICKRSRGGLYS